MNQTESPFGYRTTAQEVVATIDLTDRCALVTGGYSGVGLETVKALAHAGAEVIIAGRNLEAAMQAAETINEALTKPLVSAYSLDLADLNSVNSFAGHCADLHPKVDMLIANAAVMACPFGHTKDGFEQQFGTNHLGHFALIEGLLPALRKAQGARIVCLSSTGHFRSPVMFDDIQFENRDYDPWAGYGQSKTANSLTAVGLQAELADDGIEAFAVHPGGIMTNLQRHMSTEEIVQRGWVDEAGNINERFKTTEQGASTTVWAATAPELAGRGGRYLEDCGEAVVRAEPAADFTGVMQYAVDPANAEQLLSVSRSLLA